MAEENVETIQVGSVEDLKYQVNDLFSRLLQVEAELASKEKAYKKEKRLNRALLKLILWKQEN